MKQYRPKSWSESARALSDKAVSNVNGGRWCFEEASRFFCKSYRHPWIVQRAAKRYGRLVRAGKVHEESHAVDRWKAYKAKYNIQD